MRTTSLRRFGHEQATPAATPYLLCTVHGVTYAVALLSVREVMDLVRLAPVADAPAALRGTQVLRGQQIPVVDLGAVLEQRPLRLTRTSCTLVVQNLVVQRPAVQTPLVEGVAVRSDPAAGEALVGLAVDGVSGVKGLADVDLSPVSRLGETMAMDVVSAMANTADGLVAVLDPARILASADVRRAVAAWHAAEASAAQPVA